VAVDAVHTPIFLLDQNGVVPAEGKGEKEENTNSEFSAWGWGGDFKTKFDAPVIR